MPEPRRTLTGRNDALAVSGLTQLRRVLANMEGDTDKRLRQELRVIGMRVRDRARAYAPVGPRPKRSTTKPLRQSVRVSVVRRGVSVYSNEEHAIVQDVGGQVGRDGATLLPRASVSRYMTRAVQESSADVEYRVQQLLDNLENEFNS